MMVGGHQYSFSIAVNNVDCKNQAITFKTTVIYKQILFRDLKIFGLDQGPVLYTGDNPIGYYKIDLVTSFMEIDDGS